MLLRIFITGGLENGYINLLQINSNNVTNDIDIGAF